MDVHDKKTRSFNMSQIKSSGTKPEKTVRSLCHKLGLRFRLNRTIHGTKPDLVLVSRKLAVFVHGCFWHSHNCKFGNVYPKTNAIFWAEKRQRTLERDFQNIKNLEEISWSALVIWECDLKDLDKTQKKILDKISTLF